MREKDLRLNRVRPHPCRVNDLRLRNFVNRPGRLFHSFEIFLRTSFAFLLAAVPLLLLAAPRQGKENSAPSASQPAQQQSAVTNFPQLPYQGSPPELPQDQGTLGLRLIMGR